MPYVEHYDKVTFNHLARMSEHTVMTNEEPHLWRVRQTLIDEPPAPVYELEEPAEPDNSAFLHFVVDLRGNTNPPGALLSLVRVETEATS